VGPVKEGFIVGFDLLKTFIDMGSRIKANEGSSLEVYDAKVSARSSVKGLDLNKLLNNHTEFNKLLDDDDVRVCLLLALDFVFIGFELRHIIANKLLGLVDDLSAWNDFPWVPTGRYVVPTGRYVVPTGRVIVPTGRYIVPTGRVIVTTDRIVSPGSDNDSDNASIHNEAPNNHQQPNIQPQIITTVSNNNAKFPYLKKDEYEVWAIKMEYWITNNDMNILKVIQNGNRLKRTGRDNDGGLIILPPTTAEEHLAVQRESKARTTLLQ
nr:phospholipase-like protein [Tanacetum cinerariifolium]